MQKNKKIDFKETGFQAEIRKSIDHFNGFYYKSSDRSKGHKKPFDCIIILCGKIIFAETKLHKSSKPWLLSKVKKHQVSSLLEIFVSSFDRPLQINNAKAEIWINVRYDNYDFISVIPVREFIALKNSFDRKSLSISELRRCTMIQRTKCGKYWDLERYCKT